MKTPKRLFLVTGSAFLLLQAGDVRADYATEMLALQPLTYWRFGENVTVPAYDTATNLGSLGAAGNGSYVDRFVRPVEGAIAGDTAVGFSNPALTTDYFGAMGVPNNAALNPSGAFSIEFWAKPSNETASLLSPVNSMSFVTGRAGWLFYQNAATWQFRVGVSASTTASILNGGVIQSNRWQHVVGVFTPTTPPAGTMTLYVDGAQVATGAGNYEPNTDAGFFVGSTASPNRTFDGAVDEVAFYAGVLSADKIAAHYAAQSTNAAGYAAQVLADAPVGYWRLNEPAKVYPAAVNAGTLGSGEDGKYAGVTNVAGPSGAAYPGLEVNNNAAAFDGTASSYVEAKSFGLSGPMTLIAWVNPNVLSGDRAIAGESGSYAFKLSETELRFTTPGILDHTSAGAGLQPGVWQQVAVTFIPGAVGGAQFFVNGEAAGAPLDASALNPGTVAFWVGKNQWAGQYLDGAIDELAVFGRALTLGNIKSLYLTASGSSTAPYMVSDPPTVSPAGTVYATTSFSITPDVAGTLPMQYQWRRNGTAIPGATSATYIKESAATSDAGTYDVVVSNAFGTVTSQTVTITVDPAVPPTIEQQPAARFVYLGGQALFAVVASGTQPLTYQWKHAGTNVPGATNATLTVSNVGEGDLGAYAVGLTNVAGGRLSATVNLTLVTPAANTYESAVVAAGPAAYWRLSETSGATAYDYAGAADGAVVGNTTQNTPGPSAPTFPGLGANNLGYTFDGTDSYLQSRSLGLAGPITAMAWVKPTASSGDRAVTGENASWAFKLADAELRFTTPGILDHTSSGANLVAGEWQHVAVTFEPGAADGCKFYHNGRFVSSAAASALTKGNSTFWTGKNQWSGQNFDGVIDEVAVFGKALSADAIAEIFAAGAFGPSTAPRIVSQPASQDVVAGFPGTLTVAAEGSFPLQYQWKKAGVDVPGGTNAVLRFGTVGYGDAESYTVTVVNGAGSITSAAARLNVWPEPTYANLTNGLVVHLGFEGNYNDTSGRGNNASAPGGDPPFIPGMVGQGVHLATTPNVNYLFISESGTDLAFEEDTSFTVSFWTKYTSGFNDVPIIGNAVNSTWQIGWVFTDSATVGRIEWSLSSVADTGTWLRDPVPGCPPINDGQWHNVIGVVDRAQTLATLYVDGVAASSWPLTGLGGLNPGNAVTIGQDPTGAYGNATFDLDDVGIWRRALSAYEAASIYGAAANSGQSFDVYGPVKLDIAVGGGGVVIAWQAGILESNDDLRNASGWSVVSGAAPPNYRVAAGEANKYYRVKLN